MQRGTRRNESVRAAADGMTELTIYVIAQDVVGRDALVRTFEVTLDELRPRLVSAVIDAVTGISEIPAKVSSALEAVVAIGERSIDESEGLRRKTDPAMNVVLDLHQDENLELLRLVGPVVIYAEVFADTPHDPVVTADDCGSDLTLRLRPQEMMRIAEKAHVPSGAFQPVPPWKGRFSRRPT